MNLYVWLNKRHSEKFIAKLEKQVDDINSGKAKLTRVEDFSRWSDEIEMFRESRSPVRKIYDKAWCVLFGIDGLFTCKLRPRYIINHVVWARQRMRRGWADSDCWSIDSHVCRMLGGMLAHLADHNMAYPGQPPFDTPEKWEAHLRDLSKRMLAWDNETFREQAAFQVTQDALKEFADRLGWYWD
jgi:hypothetical protein